MKHAFEREKNAAVRAVRAASDLCTRVRASLAEGSTAVKHDQSPVTVADFGSQAIVCKILRETFPDDQVVAEEDSQELTRQENRDLLMDVVRHVNKCYPKASASDICSWIDWGRQEPSERFWTLDPIDGTKGFLRGDQYAIALALVEEGKIRLGVLGCPNLHIATGRVEGKKGALFLGLKRHGAIQTDMKGKDRTPIRVSAVAEPAQARLTESFEAAHSDHTAHQCIARRLNINRPSLRMDSQAKYAVLARGEASIYLRLPSPKSPDYRERIWDHAAGSIIIEEAGGKVTDVKGRSLDFTQGKRLQMNQGVVATNGLIHSSVLEALRVELEAHR